MKILGVFRGFPGLGRVVSGVEILKQLKEEHKADIKICTYLQGAEYLQRTSVEFEGIKSHSDICSIGIIPVSSSGERIIDMVEEYRPDFVLVDGEPMLIGALKLCFPKLKIVALLNPFDVDNPHNKLSSQLFFKDAYAKADVSIVHGLWSVPKPHDYNSKFYSFNTIIRREILGIKTSNPKDKIVCVLGGGTVNSSEPFYTSTLAIAENTISIAIHYPQYSFDILCGSPNIYDRIKSSVNIPPNVFFSKELKTPEEMYSRAKIIIARAGRNTISELLQLNIPSILYATGCSLRGSEQKKNIEFIENFSNGNIIGIKTMGTMGNVLSSFENSLTKHIIKNNWICGNMKVQEILRKVL